MQKKNYVQEILDIIHSGLPQAELAEKLSDYHENDLADALADLTAEERRKLYAILGVEQVAEIFSYLDDAEPYLKELPPEEAAQVVSHMDSDDAVDALDDLEEEDKEKIVHQMDKVDKDAADDVKLLLSYDEDEIGSRMTTNYVAIRSDLTVRQAMKELVRQAADNDNISTLYAVDDADVLVGAIDLKELIIARENMALEDILMTSYPYVYADELVEDCIERIRGYSEDSIPVLDAENRLCGALTAQDVAELVADELGDDYAKLGGLTAEEDLQEPLVRSISKRLPWLVVLLGLGLVVSSVVGLFERVVTHLAVVICFQSMVLDMAGNVGTQSLAVTIRVLMDEEVSSRQKLALIGKEARIGLVNGMILGGLSFLAIGLYLMVMKGHPPFFAFSVSFCTGAALLAAMLLSSIVGTIVPILFKRLGVDPAVASGPLITTINDLVAVVVYYGLAMIVLIDMFHLG